MRFAILSAACVFIVIATCITFAFLPAPYSWQLARWALVFTYSSALFGAVYAAFGFGPGDRLRWAWGLMASYTIIGVGKVILWGSPRHVGPAMGAWPQSLTPLASGSATIMLNLLSCSGLALFARVWNGTGLTPPWRGRATLVAFAVALAIGGLPVVRDIQMISAGQGLRIAGLASSLGDIISIALIGPVLVTAIAMRGGLLVWPWSLLTASSFAWLLFDAVLLLPPGLQPVGDLFTTMAGTITAGAAGVAHRWAVEHN
jgi:hypothetical protein